MENSNTVLLAAALAEANIRFKYNYSLKNYSDFPATGEYSLTSKKGERPWHRIMYIESGVAEIVFADGRFSAPSGSLVCFPSDCEFSLCWRKENGCAVANSYIIAFSAFNESNHEIGIGKNPFIVCVRKSEYICKLFSDSVTEFSCAGVGARLKCVALLCELLGTIIDNSSEGESKSEISTATTFINENYASDISVNMLTSLCHISESTLRRAFLAETGMSPVKYINKVRMTKSYELLTSGKMSVGEVAAEVNIPDLSYFSRLFKATYGFSPAKIRNRDI